MVKRINPVKLLLNKQHRPLHGLWISGFIGGGAKLPKTKLGLWGLGMTVAIFLMLFGSVQGLTVPAPLPLGIMAQETNTPAVEKTFDELIAGSEKLAGLFTLYYHKESQQLYLELSPEQLQQKFLCFISLGTGLGEAGFIRGVPISDFLFEFRRQQNQIQFVMPNIKFRADFDDPQRRSVQQSFSESILYSLPIKSIHPQRQTLLINVSDWLLADRDLSGLGMIVPQILGTGYTIDKNQSHFSDAQAFPFNVEIESTYRFLGGNPQQLTTVPDSRALDLRVRYSITSLPENRGITYRPRLADDRVGYFITAYQNFSQDTLQQPFVRYINRWHLEKLHPDAPLSPPVEPIVFWIENTVPLEYRDAIREGVLMWNRAFEQAGLINAIEVKQMPDDADWHPADVRYNTIRWSTAFNSSFAGFGPSHVNPLTGQILDADIILDANAVRYMKQGARLFTQNEQSFNTAVANQQFCQQETLSRYLPELANADSGETRYQPWKNSQFPLFPVDDACFRVESSHQLSIGALSLSLVQGVPLHTLPMKEYVHQYLRYLTAHEVGHTLGLRHNFHGSTFLPLEDLHNVEITRTQGLVSSVMDYLPVNLAAPGAPQGEYYPSIVGPYDRWAIEYGYTPAPGNHPMAEGRFLEAIASRASQDPALAYATDEDSFDILDPAANIFDLSQDMLGYSRWQLDNAKILWERLAKLSPPPGEGYSEIRLMFDHVFAYYFNHVLNSTLYIGGQSFNRSARGESYGSSRQPLPFAPISGEKQREALALINQYVFSPTAFNFSPDLLNKLAPSRWLHWGSSVIVSPLDYLIQDRLTSFQSVVLRLLLSNIRLTRLRDLELKAPGENVLTLPELFETLRQNIWTEVLVEDGNGPEIVSFRRSLQREHLNLLTAMVLRQSPVPEDARSLAWYELRYLRDALTRMIRTRGKQLDRYTLAHLEETRDRMSKALEASLQSN